MEPEPPVADTPCPNCGAVRQGPYCHQCGQKRLTPEDRTVRRLFQHAFEAATSMDGRLWQSIRVLLFKPGKLTLDYVEGRRQGYVHPFRLFLLINVLYFLVQPFTGFTGYNTTFESHLNRQFYSDRVDLLTPVQTRIKTMLTETLEAEGVDPESLAPATYEARWRTVNRQYEARFNQRSSTYARSLILIFIPMIAGVLWLLYLRRPWLLADHVLFATHLMGWQLLFVGCLYLPLLGLLSYGVVALFADGTQGLQALMAAKPWVRTLVVWMGEYSSLFWIVLYQWFALRRFYDDGWLRASVHTALLLVAGLIMIILYRFTLFWLTYWTV